MADAEVGADSEAVDDHPGSGRSTFPGREVAVEETNDPPDEVPRKEERPGC